jgi:glycosyltransferase involved in cell wall biosynthesis
MFLKRAFKHYILNTRFWRSRPAYHQGPNERLQDEPLPNEPLPNEPLPDEPLPNEPLPDEPLPNEPLPDEPLPNEPLPNEPLPNEPLPNEPPLNEPLPDEPLPNEPLLNEPLPSQQLANEPLANQRLIETIKKAADGFAWADSELAETAILNDPSAANSAKPYDQGPLPLAFAAFFKTLTTAYDHIVFVPSLVYGGAEMVAMQVARAAVKNSRHERVLVVATDSDTSITRHWLPEGVDLSILRAHGAALNADDMPRFVAGIIQSIRPKSVMNVNSRACWEAFRIFGRPLAVTTDLFAMLFCRDYNGAGRAVGYSDSHFRSCFPNLKSVYFDTEMFPRELAERFGILGNGRRQLITARPPPPDDINEWVRPCTEKDRRFSVLWAGRLCRQKNLSLLIDLARVASDIDFYVYGIAADEAAELLRQAEPTLPNLFLEGEYRSFGSLPIGRFDAFLYTSLWDGMPRVLVEAASAGMPIVASEVGGIRELVDDSTGWLVSSGVDPHPYLEALNAIRDLPDEADRRRRRLSVKVQSEHNSAKFRAELASGGFLGD